jgi:hypothetical protein
MVDDVVVIVVVGSFLFVCVGCLFLDRNKRRTNFTLIYSGHERDREVEIMSYNSSL